MRKKNLLKRILSTFVVIAMVTGSLVNDAHFYANASTSPKTLASTYFNASEKYLYLGKKDNNSFDFNIKKDVKGAKYSWYINKDKGNPKAVTINSNTGIVTAKKAGTAYIGCKITLKKGNTLKPEAKVIVRNNITKVEIINKDISVDKAASAKTQDELDKLLNSESIEQITIDTNNAVTFTIAKGDYSNKTLIVNAENADVNNYGIFKSVKINAIKDHTWIEFANGNIINLSDKVSSIIIDKNAEVKQIVVDTPNSTVNFDIQGKVEHISVTQPSQINISGSNNKVPLTIEKTAEGSTITASTSLDLNVKAKTDINLNKGAENTTLDRSDNSVVVTIVNNTTKTVTITTNNKSAETVTTGNTLVIKTPSIPTPEPVAAIIGGGGGGGGVPSTPTTPTTPTTPATPTAPATPTTPATAAAITVSPIPTAAPTPTTPGELLANGNLESGLTPWTNNDTATVAINSTEHSSGSNCLFVSGRAATYAGPKQDVSGKVVAGHIYSYTANVKYTTAETSRKFIMGIVLGSNPYEGNKEMGSVTINRGVWGTITGTFIVPEGASTSPVFVYLGTPYGGNDKSDFYADDISFIDLGAPAPTATPTPKPIQPYLADTNYNVPSDFWDYNPAVNYGEIKDIQYFSTATNSTRNAKVLLPAGYSTSKKYPVLYLLHGIGGNETTLSGDIGLLRVIGNAIASGAAEKMIVVFPNGCANATGTCPKDAQGKDLFFSLEHYKAYDNFLNDFRDSLVPYINQNFSTATGRENTAISGFSMGGRVALHIGFTLPNMVRYIGGFCPAYGILEYTNNGVHENGLFTPQTFTLPSTYMNDTLVLIAAGKHDYTVWDEPLKYHNALITNNVPHIYYETMGGINDTGDGGHGGDVYRHGIYNFIRRIFH